MLSNMALVEIAGFASAVCLLVALLARPVGMFAVFFALAIVGAAILVGWNDVVGFRAQRQAQSAVQRTVAAVPPNLTVPPAVGARARS
jgi:hypothetical protein